MTNRSPLDDVLSGLHKVHKRQASDWWDGLCPAHDDNKRSLSITVGRDGQVVFKCQAGCDFDSIVAHLGMEPKDLYPNTDKAPSRRIEAKYDYVDEDGNDLYQVVKYSNKDFLQRRRVDGKWEWGLDKVRRVLYRLPELVTAVAAGQQICITEGEKDADHLAALGLAATTNSGGAGKWRLEYAHYFTGAEVVVLPDNDDQGRSHAQTIAQALHTTVKSVTILNLPDLPEKGDVTDWLNAGGTAQALEALVDDTTEWGPASPAEQAALLGAVRDTFAKWLHLPDLVPLYAVLGAIAANRLEGDPFWLLLVGPPGCGKSEIESATSGLDNVHPAGTITEASLLSGTPKKEATGKGGLLREIGDLGIILFKDFGSVLSMHREARAAVLAALREIYDGSWTRLVGTDGGRTLHWSGKVGMVAGATPTIDRHHTVMSAMGERFTMLRFADTDTGPQAQRSLHNAGRETEMRSELAAVVKELFAAGLGTPRALNDEERDQLVTLAVFTVRARSAVERNSYSREIELVPQPEAPGRLVKQLAGMLNGLDALGIDRTAAWQVVTRLAQDSIPRLRLSVIEVLYQPGGGRTTTWVSEQVEHPTQTARRVLEDLTAHGIVERTSQGPGKADTWALSDWARDRYEQVLGGLPESPSPTFPETSGEERNVSQPCPQAFPETSGGGSNPNPVRDSSASKLPSPVQDDISGKVPPENHTAADCPDLGGACDHCFCGAIVDSYTPDGEPRCADHLDNNGEQKPLFDRPQPLERYARDH